MSSAATPIPVGARTRSPLGERLFHYCATAALSFEVLFISTVILAAAWYVDLDDLKATVSSPSMRYAMRMSITSVTITTLISVSYTHLDRGCSWRPWTSLDAATSTCPGRRSGSPWPRIGTL